MTDMINNSIESTYSIFHSDEHARYISDDENVMTPNSKIPPLADIPISQVNKALYSLKD